MNKTELKELLVKNPGYLKSGSKTLASRFNISRRLAKLAVQEVKVESQHPIGKFKRLFVDIETSPNIGWFWSASWKTSIGTHQITDERKVICVSYKWQGESEVHRLYWDEAKCDKELLKKLSKVMLLADEVIAHNGDRFDIPWLRTRCLIHGIFFPTYVNSLDTLKKAKSMFNFQSNRLDYIGTVLGCGGKIKIDPEVWKDVVFSSVGTDTYKQALSVMLEYCDYDVILLEDIFNRLESYIKPNTHVGISQNKDRYSCPMCGNDTSVNYIKPTVTASGIIKRHMVCDNCNADYIIPNNVFIKLNTKK